MVRATDQQVANRPPTHDEVRVFLRKLLASDDFSASERNRRFLSYVVEETLSGRGSRIKAYNVALAAFDRGKDFDPLADPIVRIEAGRLRRSLEHYYLTAGRSDWIRIDIPKGSYVAAFSRVEPDHEMNADDWVGPEAPDMPKSPPTATRPVPTLRVLGRRAQALVAVLTVAIGILIAIQLIWSFGRAEDALPRGPKVIVYPFEEVSNESAQAFISRGMTYDIIANLTRFTDLFVYGPETSFSMANDHKQERTRSIVQADFALTGSVLLTEKTVRVSAYLSDLHTGRYVWSWSNEWILAPSTLLGAQADIAEHVARAVGQPYGSVFERGAEEIAGKPAGDLLSYECVVRFQQYWRAYDVGKYDDLLACMKQTIARDPEYARAYSSLALLYVDAHRFGYGTETLTFDPVQRALELADKAIELEPMASDGYLALSVARWFDHNVGGSLEAAEQGLALNPNNTILLGELGIRYALLARWDESRAMIDKFFALNPRAPAGYRRANFLYAYMHHDYRSALTELMSAELPLNIYDYVFRAMTYAQLEDEQNAQAAVSQILTFDPNYGEHVAADFRQRNTDPSIVRAIVDGLTKAGLPSSLKSGANRSGTAKD
jgi:adenylate cyclase